jgi:hypothetical protein
LAEYEARFFINPEWKQSLELKFGNKVWKFLLFGNQGSEWSGFWKAVAMVAKSKRVVKGF